MIYDIAIIGGGLLGLASANELLARDPRKKIIVVEKERRVASHQSGRNSGVIHAGVYYKPGSFKASFCREGKQLLEKFCDEESVRYKRIGKLIVATDIRDIPKLDTLFERATTNGVNCKRLSSEMIKEIEPHAAGVSGIHVPETGIVDFPGVATAIQKRIQKVGGEIKTDSALVGANRAEGLWQLETSSGQISCRTVLNCGGLHSDKIAMMMGITPEVRIIPFRGEYWLIREEKSNLCNGLIYPVPDPKFPFLGVHVTRMINGRVECGPNAVLALSREGYSWSNVSLFHLGFLATFKPFWKFSLRNLSYGLGETWRSLSKRSFASAVRELLPSINDEDLEPGSSGVRAQAMTLDGKLCDDFVIQKGAASIHVLNAPSPAATACFAIGKHIASLMP